MKIVNMCGGLGNQMFQYAFALALKHRYPNEKVMLDTHHYRTILPKKIGHINMHNGYEVHNIFRNADLPIAGALDIIKLSYYMPDYHMSRFIRRYFPKRRTEYVIPTDRSFLYSEDALQQTGSCYYEGYWQALPYFDEIRDTIRSVFDFGTPDGKNKEYSEIISRPDSVGIHVRRGDYIKHPVFGGICEAEYYRKALEKINEDGRKHSYFIFSNDSQWCRDNLSTIIGDAEIHYIEYNKGNKSFWDMYLMSQCRQLVISNSSFSWWAAYLSKNIEKVYVPAKWAHTDDTVDLYKKDWILI